MINLAYILLSLPLSLSPIPSIFLFKRFPFIFKSTTQSSTEHFSSISAYLPRGIIKLYMESEGFSPFTPGIKTLRNILSRFLRYWIFCNNWMKLWAGLERSPYQLNEDRTENKWLAAAPEAYIEKTVKKDRIDCELSLTGRKSARIPFGQFIGENRYQLMISGVFIQHLENTPHFREVSGNTLRSRCLDLFLGR